MHLVHKTLLAVVVSILHGVDLVHKGRLGLLVVTLAGGVVRSGAAKAVASGVAVVVVCTSKAGASSSTRCGVATVVSSSASCYGSANSSVVSTSSGVGVTSNRARLTLKAVVTLFTASEGTTLPLELLHADSRKGGCRVVLSSVVVDLVDGNSGVNNVRLNGLLVHDRLDGLMHVVVNVLACDSRGNALGVTLGTLLTDIAELSSLSSETLGDLTVVAVLELTVLNGTKVVVVLLWEDFTILDRLDRGVVVVLVNLLIESSLDILVTLTVDGLVSDCRCNLLVDGGVVVTRLGHKVLDCCLGGFHYV